MTKVSHAAEVTAGFDVVKHVIARVTGIPAPSLKSFSVLERWFDGEEISRDDLEAACKQAHDAGTKIWNTNVHLSWASTAIGNLCWLAQKRGNWRDARRTILDACVYATRGDTRSALTKLWDEQYANAEKAGVKVKAPKGPRIIEVDAAIAKTIGAHAYAWLKGDDAKIDTSKRADEKTLRTLLATNKYPCHPAVVDFEARYGGIETNAGWLFGPYACVASGAHSHPTGNRPKEKLVPVAFSGNDIIYYLDARGRGWAEDTIEDPKAVLFATDPDRVVAKIGCFNALCARYYERRADLAGAHGAKAARRAKVPKLAHPSDEHSRFWGDDSTLISEVTEGKTIRTTITSDDPSLVARLSGRDSA